MLEDELLRSVCEECRDEGALGLNSRSCDEEEATMLEVDARKLVPEAEVVMPRSFLGNVSLSFSGKDVLAALGIDGVEEEFGKA